MDKKLILSCFETKVVLEINTHHCLVTNTSTVCLEGIIKTMKDFENSKIGYYFSWRSRTRVRFATYLGTTQVRWRNRTHQYKGTSSPGEFLPTKCWVRNLLVKNFVIFSDKILGTTSPEK
jgi:hypothetical protein